MVSASDAAMLLDADTKGGQGVVAEAVLFRQLVLTTRALFEAHMAMRDARQASAIADAVGAKLDAVRARLPRIPSTSTKNAPAAAPTATATLLLDPRAEEARRILDAQRGTRRARPSNPIPNGIEPAKPATPTVRPERDGHDR